MAISQLLRDTFFARLMAGDSARSGFIVSMTGVALGDRLLVVGLAEPSLLGLLGGKVGLSGRACGVDASDQLVTRAAQRAQRAGVLVEVQCAPFAELPFDADSFDVVIVRARGALADDGRLGTALRGSRQVLRDGGRCVALVDTGSGLWARRPSPRPERILELFDAQGYRAARILAERQGLGFVEAVSRRQRS